MSDIEAIFLKDLSQEKAIEKFREIKASLA
jgi:hypothetical protein